VDQAALKALGARGVVRPSERDLQVVLGPQADDVAREIRAELAAAAVSPENPSTPDPAVQRPDIAQLDVSALLAAIGGPENVVRLQDTSSRLVLDLKHPERIDAAALRRLGVRALARPASGALHLILGPAVQAVNRGVKAALRA
jgi:PTS system N-acetylglucosamine-specific IIC component